MKQALSAIFTVSILLYANPARALDKTDLMKLPDIQRNKGSSYLFENHSTAYLIWHAYNIKGATLVHLDTHDDCRHISTEKIEQLNELLKTNDLTSIYRLSDQSFVSRFITKPDDELFHLGNFIYPCIVDGTISNFYWVIPDISIDNNRLEALKMALTTALSPDVTDARIIDNILTMKIRSCTLSVVTIDSLPKQPAGCLLDIDTDYFSFANALSENHITGRLIHDPELTMKAVSKKVPRPKVTTICSSVWGGYLPVSLRFISDGVFDYVTRGSYPKDASILMQSTIKLRECELSGIQLIEPRAKQYLAASLYMKALYQLIKGDDSNASHLAEKAAKTKYIYLKGLLDCSEALTMKGKQDMAYSLIDIFEKMTATATTDSMTARTRVLISQRKFTEAEQLGRKLVEWDRQPYTENILGGILVDQGKYQEALDIFSSILRLKPIDSVALYNSGLALYRQGKIDQSLDLFEKSLISNPDFVGSLEYLGCIYMDKKDYTRAVEYLSAALKISPLSLAIANNLGLSYLRSGKNKEAISCLEQAVSINNLSPETHANLATAYLGAGVRTEALKHIDLALELKPGWQEVMELRKETTRIQDSEVRIQKSE